MIRTVAFASAAVAVLAAPAAAAPGAAKTIAVVTEGGLRAVVAAHKTSSGRAPTATITVTSYRAAGHAWQRTRTNRLSGTFFWKTVTTPHAVCRLELAGTNLSLSLLVSPSIGCSKTSVLPL